MSHPYTGYLVCRDNYFTNPEEVIKLSKMCNFSRSTYYPGIRTGNLLGIEDPGIKDFADWFADRVSIDVFPLIRNFEFFLCFHINEPCDDMNYNKGWIHTDYGNLAGLVYLTEGESDMNTGTSIFDPDRTDINDIQELPTDKEALKNFYLHEKITPEYVTGFKNNLDLFESKETIRIGNKYNRLIGYDSKLWHRPNSFTTVSNAPRLTLLFFVSQFNY